MIPSNFESDRRRYFAAAKLRPEHFEDFSRLVKTLRFGSRFQLLILEFNEVPYRDALRQQLDDVLRSEGLHPGSLTIRRDHVFPTFAELEIRLVELATVHQALHLLGGEDWFDVARWQQFNLRREAVAQRVNARLLLWLTTATIEEMALAAPDNWAWRSGVFSFTTPLQSLPAATRSSVDPHRMQHASKFMRIAELRHDLGLEAPLPQDIRLRLWDELGSLLESVGELDEALRIREEEELPVYERLGDVRSKAVTRGKIADILQTRGELDEALRIHQEVQLPVYERLGDAREKAVTYGKIADILFFRGELGEALRILRDEVLPAFEHLGDVRLKAVTHGKIADILCLRGELDEALRIYQEVQLPVYERLGDVRSKAMAHQKIADILGLRGELDKALRTYEQQLPLYERLGDVRSKAVTHGKIADILRSRGELEEAQRIHEEVELPVYERLGDVRSIAVTHGKIAEILRSRGYLEKALQIWTEEVLPPLQRLRLPREIAWALEKIEELEAAASQPRS